MSMPLRIPKFRAYIDGLSSEGHRLAFTPFKVVSIDFEDGTYDAINERNDERYHFYFRGTFGFVQYTELKDCEDKEIYENDIVIYEETSPDDFEKYYQMIGEVKLIEGTWYVENTARKRKFPLFSKTAIIKVIGDSFNDSKLLEED